MIFFKDSGARVASENGAKAALCDVVAGYSIEIMPRTSAKIDDFTALLPPQTRVYIAHIEGTPIDDMIATAARLSGQGYQVMPHFPARIIENVEILETWIRRYREEAGVEQALVLAGGVAKPYGEFDSSMQLLQSGLFDKYGYKRLHVAGHPEGCKDIDRDGSSKLADEALAWKQSFRAQSDAEMAIVTQFVFDADPVIDWAARLQDQGITLPIHVGIAGPAKLQTLIKFSIACGVGASLKVLQKRAMDVSKLLLPYEPSQVLSGFADHKATVRDSLIEQIHFFPLGGIKTNANWANALSD